MRITVISNKKTIYLALFIFIILQFVFTDDLEIKTQDINVKDFKIINVSKDVIDNDINFEWMKEYNLGDKVEIEKIINTSDNGFTVVGSIYDSEMLKNNISAYSQAWNMLVFKADRTGKEEWTKKINVNIKDFGNDIINTSDGCFLITGSTVDEFSGYSDDMVPNILLVKLNKDGQTIWIKNIYDKQTIVESLLEHNNNYFVFGEKTPESIEDLKSGEFGAYILKADMEGNKVNDYIVKIDKGIGRIKRIIEIGNKEYFLLSWKINSLLKVRINENIEIKWNKLYLTVSNSNKNLKVFAEANDLIKSSNDSIIITGSYYFKDEKGKEVERIFVFKVDEDGNPLWMRVFVNDEIYGLRGSSIVETKNGEYIIAGYTNSKSNNQSKMVLLKVNDNGELQWMQINNNDKYKESELKYLVASDDENSVIVAGTTLKNGDKNNSLFLGKVNIDEIDVKKK